MYFIIIKEKSNTSLPTSGFTSIYEVDHDVKDPNAYLETVASDFSTTDGFYFTKAIVTFELRKLEDNIVESIKEIKYKYESKSDTNFSWKHQNTIEFTPPVKIEEDCIICYDKSLLGLGEKIGCCLKMGYLPHGHLQTSTLASNYWQPMIKLTHNKL